MKLSDEDKLRIAMEALRKIEDLGMECRGTKFESDEDRYLFITAQFALALGISIGTLGKLGWKK